MNFQRGLKVMYPSKPMPVIDLTAPPEARVRGTSIV
jgi:hypothetical protein